MRCGFLTLYSLLLALNVSAQDAPVAGGAFASVSGRVVQEPVGTPVSKVSVVLQSTRNQFVPMDEGVQLERLGPGGRLSGVTDADGQFQIRSVPAGEYRVWLQKSGFVATGRRSQQDSSTFISVAKGQELASLLFRMLPAGVIKGKIVDEDGDVVEGASVIATFAHGRNVSANATTNDSGEYRLSGLQPGKYLVIAQADNRSRAGTGTTVYAPTFFPGTVDRAQAATVDVHPGDEAQSSFGLVVSRVFTVKGQIVGLSSGKAPRNLMFYPMESGADSPISGTVSLDGTFVVRNVLPGSYRPLMMSSDRGGWSTEPGAEIVEVRGADLEGVRITPEPPGQVRGRFRLDTGQPFKWTQLTLSLSRDDGENGFSEPLSVKAQSDGSFTLDKVPAGNYHILVTADSNNLRDYIVKEVNVNGRDAADSGFAVGRGISVVEIVASANGSSIGGTVVDGENKTVADVQVICIPDETRRKRRDIYQVERTDKRGQFSMRGLNPGDYIIFALEGEATDITDPDFIQQYESRGQKVHVDDGENKTITVKFSWDSEP